MNKPSRSRLVQFFSVACIAYCVLLTPSLVSAKDGQSSAQDAKAEKAKKQAEAETEKAKKQAEAEAEKAKKQAEAEAEKAEAKEEKADAKEEKKAAKTSGGSPTAVPELSTSGLLPAMMLLLGGAYLVTARRRAQRV